MDGKRLLSESEPGLDGDTSSLKRKPPLQDRKFRRCKKFLKNGLTGAFAFGLTAMRLNETNERQMESPPSLCAKRNGGDWI
jgi:hypothetical protein